jgi:hypothetical protein
MRVEVAADIGAGESIVERSAAPEKDVQRVETARGRGELSQEGPKRSQFALVEPACGQALPKGEHALRCPFPIEEAVEDDIEELAIPRMLHDHGGDGLRDVGPPLQADSGDGASYIHGLRRRNGEALSAQHPEELIEHTDDGVQVGHG